MSDYIAHHGIKGQKWGHQNGPPYPLNESDKSSAEKAAARKAYAKKISADTGYLSVVEAEKQIEHDREMLKKIAIAGAAVAIGAGCYYCYTKLEKDPYGSDYILKAGQTIGRTATGKTDKLHDVFYATPDQQDVEVYKHRWGRTMGTFGSNKYLKEYETKQDLKIAGKPTCKKEYDDLMKNSLDFKNAVRKEGIKGYKDFDRKIVILSKSKSDAFDIYRKNLESKGYSGMIDFNDKYGLGLGTKAPTIFFGGNTNFATKSVHQLTDSEIKAGKEIANKVVLKHLADIESKRLIALGSAAVAVGGIGLTQMNAAEKRAYEKEQKKINK